MVNPDTSALLYKLLSIEKYHSESNALMKTEFDLKIFFPLSYISIQQKDRLLCPGNRMGIGYISSKNFAKMQILP